jgi:outer membrane protein
MKTRDFWLYLAMAALGATHPLRADTATRLTLGEARALALRMHPSITVAELRALVAKDVATEVRAAYFPQVSGNVTAVGTGNSLTRLAAGSLSNSQIYDRVGVGAVVTQLITDFGRTQNLTAAARLRARAAESNVLAARAQLLLAVDAAYFSVLEAQAVKSVALKTLNNRQSLLDQVDTLEKNKLRSELDVRFGRVAVDEARLLVSKADADWQSALATLTNLLGQRTLVTAELVEPPESLSDLPAESEPLTELALRQRPELLEQRSEHEAAQAAARAAADARRPTIAAIGSAGVVPIRNDHFEHDYAAGGVNLNVPLFAGGSYVARQREAELQADAAEAALREEENNVVREVRVAWLQAAHARERVTLTASLLENSNAVVDLAQARFGQGINSIIELNQAQLSQVSAEIAHANAQYDYRMQRDILDFQTGSLH